MLTKATEGDVTGPTVSPEGTRLAMGISVSGVIKLAMARVEENWFTAGKAPDPITHVTLRGRADLVWRLAGSVSVGW